MKRYKDINRLQKVPRNGSQGLIFWLVLAVLAVSLVVCPVAVAFASNTTLAEYLGTIRISNTGASASNVFTVFSLNTSGLIDNDYVSDNCLNTALLTNAAADTAYMPARNGTDNWCVYAPSIGADSNLDYKLYTGGSHDMSGKIRYFPDTGGMSANDSASLELGANFTIKQKGYINTSTSGTAQQLISKGTVNSSAILVYVSASENITAGVNATATKATANLTPNGAGYITGIANVFGASTHWEAVDDNPASPDDATTYVYTTNTSYETDAYTLTAPGLGNVDIVEVNVIYRWDEVADPGYVKPGLRLDGTNQLGTGVNSGGNWATGNQTISRPGGGDWAVSDLADLEVIAQLKGSGESRLTMIYVEVVYVSDYTFDADVTASSVSSGEHTVNVTQEYDTWLSFNGTTDYVDLGSPGSLENYTAKTVLLWCKVGSGTGSTRTLYYGGYWDNPYGDYIYGRDSDDDVDIRLRNTGGTFVFHKVTNDVDTWMMLGYSWNGTHVRYYKNGAYLAGSEDAFTGTLSCNATNINFGRRSSGAGSEYFDGLIDEASIYSRALSASEILALYNKGRVGKPGYSSTNLTALWHIDEGTGATIYDETANNNDGTISGATWDGEELKIYVDGVEKDTAFTANATVTDNSENWTFLQNDVMPYMHYTKIWIDGALQQHIEWENDTTFTDLSGNSHDATPTFRTTSSNADVSAELITFEPISPSEADDWSLTTAGTMVGNVTAPSGLYDELQTHEIPGGAIIDAVATDAGVSAAMIWFPIVCLILIPVGLVVGKYSLLAQTVIMGALFFVAAGAIMAPMLGILFFVDAFAIVVASREYGF